MIQRNQKVVVVSGGDATRAIKVQTGSGTDDLSRFPLIYTDGVRGRDQEVQLVTGGDTTRIPKVTLDIDAYIRSLGPAAWFLKGQGQTVTGSGVSQWDDLSGNGRHLLQGSDAARPALQADGSVLFNGTSHYLKCNAFTLNQPTCVLMVVKQVSWTNADRLFDGNTANTGCIFQSSATPQISGTSDAVNYFTNAAGPAVGAAGVISAVFNGAASWLKVNLGATQVKNTGTGNMGGFTIGAAGNGGSPSNIQAYETVIFPIAPSTAQLDRLIAGLMARHSVT